MAKQQMVVTTTTHTVDITRYSERVIDMINLGTN